MKNQTPARPAPNSVARAPGGRPHASKTSDHRHERRKIREQLRRTDWPPVGTDEVFA